MYQFKSLCFALFNQSCYKTRCAPGGRSHRSDIERLKAHGCKRRPPRAGTENWGHVVRYSETIGGPGRDFGLLFIRLRWKYRSIRHGTATDYFKRSWWRHERNRGAAWPSKPERPNKMSRFILCYLCSKVCGIITDGASAMTGDRSPLSTLIRYKVSEEGGNAIKLQCIIHQQALCAKHPKCHHVMKPLVKAINSIGSKAPHHHQLQRLLLDTQPEYGDVIHHNDVRWLRGGSALHTFFSLRGNRTFFLWKGESNARTIRSCMAGRFGLLGWHKSFWMRWMLIFKKERQCELHSHIKAFGTKLHRFLKTLLTERTLHRTFHSFERGHWQFSSGLCRCANGELCNSFHISFCGIVRVGFLFSPLRGPWWCSATAVAGARWAAAWRRETPAAFSCSWMKVSRTSAKKLMSLFCSTYLCEQIFCHELKQELIEEKTKWLPRTWHLTHLNQCPQTRPAGLFTEIHILVESFSLVSASSVSWSIWVFWTVTSVTINNENPKAQLIHALGLMGLIWLNSWIRFVYNCWSTSRCDTSYFLNDLVKERWNKNPQLDQSEEAKYVTWFSSLIKLKKPEGRNTGPLMRITLIGHHISRSV